MSKVKIIDRLQELGMELPQLNPPLAAYVPAKRDANLIFVSGQLPLKDGRLVATGILELESQVPAGQAAMRQCFLNGLAAAATQVDLEQIEGLVRLGAFVAAGPQFHWHHLVANGASEAALAVWGDAGRHARAAVGVSSLPLNASVELELLFKIQD
ncbi:MAG: RidA family protein [Leptospiraceae bacterium]|nr:RidA family protein [Leptospiraceae bacterium]